MIKRNFTIALMAAVFIFAILLYHASSVLLPFILSFVVAYFLHPIVDRFAKSERFSRKFVSLLIMIIFFLALLAIISWVSPIIYKQSSQLTESVPKYYTTFKEEVYPKYINNLEERGIKIDYKFEEVFDKKKSLKLAHKFSSQIFSSTVSAVNIFSIIFIMPILIFYILSDWQNLVKNFRKTIPSSHHPFLYKILKDSDRVLSGFVRGQFSVCLLMAVIYGVLLGLTGLNSGLLIGIFTGLFSFIPYVGPISGFIIAIIVALFQWGLSFFDVSMVILAFAIGQIAESSFLTPKLIGDRVGLHPVWVLFGIFVFGSVFGFVGVLFAVPLTAVSGVIIKNFAKKYKENLKDLQKND